MFIYQRHCKILYGYFCFSKICIRAKLCFLRGVRSVTLLRNNLNVIMDDFHCILTHVWLHVIKKWPDNPNVPSQCLYLTHWGRVTYICISKLITIGSDNGLSPSRRQAIIWTNAGMLLIGPLGTNFGVFLIGIQILHWRKCISKWKLAFILFRPQCVNLEDILYLPASGVWYAVDHS